VKSYQLSPFKFANERVSLSLARRRFDVTSRMCIRGCTPECPGGLRATCEIRRKVRRGPGPGNFSRGFLNNDALYRVVDNVSAWAVAVPSSRVDGHTDYKQIARFFSVRGVGHPAWIFANQAGYLESLKRPRSAKAFGIEIATAGEEYTEPGRPGSHLHAEQG